jgi:hypothetical protein
MSTRRFADSPWLRLAVVTAFAVAMAYLESAAVVYLRTIFHTAPGTLAPAPRDVWFAVPYFTLLKPGALAGVLPDARIAYAEVAREASTIVMLACVGWLAGRTLKTRAAFFLYAFGVWDIGYYVFLYVLLGWPASPNALDVLFLIPSPWVAPVFVPVTASVAMILVAVLLIRSEEHHNPKVKVH